jgi:preprotein translocase subunit SecG|tara:strand:+ start:81 stop:362 length:282 start_codon:yes stop_codon:yes gene_type:complete
MIFLIGIMSFANFVFYPLVVGSIIAVIIEQILRSKGNEYDPKAVAKVNTAMGVRKYLIRQAWLFNIIWFVAYVILMLTAGRQGSPMPDMIWQG